MADFSWGDGGVQMTPERIAALRKVAQAQMAAGMDYSPVRSPWQGAARVANAAVGALQDYRASEAEQANMAADKEMIANLISGGGASPSPAVAPSVSSQPPVAPPADNIVPIGSSRAAPSGVPAPENFQPIIEQAAVKYGVSPEQLSRQLNQESGFKTNITSPVGAQGIAQFMPATAKQYGVNPNDPNSAIPGAAQYMGDLKKQFGGNDGLALAGYNWGPGNVQKWIASGADPAKVPTETRNYVQSITGKPIEAWAGRDAMAQSPSPGMQAVASAMQPQGRVAPSAPQGSGPMAGVDPRVLSAALSPYASPAVKQMAMFLVQQQMAPPELKTAGTDIYGNPVPVWAKNGTLTPATISGQGSGASSNNSAPTLSQLGISQTDTGEDLMAKLQAGSPAIANRVKQLVAGEGAMPNGRTNPIDKAAMVLAQQYDPNWNMAVWKQKSDTMADYSTKGKSGQNMENLAKISNHMNELVQSMKELGNGALPAANAVGNFVSRYGAGSEKVTNFNINANAVADEMASLMRREGMSDESIRQWRENLSPNMSEEQQKGAMRKMSSLIMERMNPLASNYERVMGKKIDLWSAFPDSKKSFDSIQSWANSPIGGKSDASAKTAPAGGIIKYDAQGNRVQ